MFIISTAHTVLILEYNIDIFANHNAAVEGDVIPSLDPRYLAFILMLLLNVSSSTFFFDFEHQIS